jgi:hypothetical protein
MPIKEGKNPKNQRKAGQREDYRKTKKRIRPKAK